MDETTRKKAKATVTTVKGRSKNWAVGILGGAAMMIMLSLVPAQVPQPGVTISLVSTNQVQIAITNAISTANYEVYRTPILGDEFFPWTLHIIGSLGQSNFTANLGIETTGFFQVAVGSDWDSDGIDNWLDAQPSNPAVGTLTITIDSPTNGSTVD